MINDDLSIIERALRCFIADAHRQRAEIMDEWYEACENKNHELIIHYLAIIQDLKDDINDANRICLKINKGEYNELQRIY